MNNKLNYYKKVILLIVQRVDRLYLKVIINEFVFVIFIFKKNKKLKMWYWLLVVRLIF